MVIAKFLLPSLRTPGASYLWICLHQVLYLTTEKHAPLD